MAALSISPACRLPFAVLLSGLCLTGLLADRSLAQTPAVAASLDQRAQEFERLAQDVARLEQQQNVLKEVVKLVRPTVVHIEAEKPDPLAKRYTHHSIEDAGSGTIIQFGDKFYVLTNRHVIKDATVNNIHIKMYDGRVVTPTQAWSDPGTDVAIMSVDAKHLLPARIGDSDKVEMGDFVLAMGSPFGLSHSVTFGIISAKGRRDLELGDEKVQFQDFMQTDAAINPGNSGGPLISLRGEVVGMNTAIASNSGGSEGIGFTIPINMAMNIAKQLVTHGSVVRAFLGVTLDSKFTQEIADQLGMSEGHGARIAAVTPRSPAEAAKLQVDDVIVQFNNVPIEDDGQLVNLVSLTEVNKVIPILVFRNRQTLKMSVKVGDRAAFEAPAKE
jgi:serine protease Do